MTSDFGNPQQQVGSLGDQPSLSRRSFLHRAQAGLTAGVVGGLVPRAHGAKAPPAATAPDSAGPLQSSTVAVGGAPTVAGFLKEYLLPKETVDRFLDPKARIWAKYHPTYGYLLRNGIFRDGVDGSQTLGRYHENGARWQVNFADQPCRINTYGDSFTQGHQSSDGETWQEILAAHFCEPIRNYGIGGYGVYQAYCRMRDNESTDQGASNIILNIWGDDHFRSVNAWRWLTIPVDAMQRMQGEMFHANPWAYARLNAQGQLEERPNICPTPESLYQLCDLEFVMDQLGNDEIVQVLFATKHGIVADPEPLDRLAATIGFKGLDYSDADAVRKSVTELYHRYAIEVGIKIVERVQELVKTQGKRLFVLLSYPSGSVWHFCAGRPADNQAFVDWHPQRFQDFLKGQGIPFVDTVQRHVEDYQQFRLTPQQYVERHYIGHYNPKGQHFFAFAIKDDLLAWLDPKPPAYQSQEAAVIYFDGYLPR
jgi:hypothetical protein